MRSLTLALGLFPLVFGLAGNFARAEESTRVEFFEKKVRPLLNRHCATCHSADTKPSGNLRVDDRNGLITGGTSGPAVVPGKPEASLLLQRIRVEGKKRMPAEGPPLSEEEIGILTTWIRDGAVWPAVNVPASLGRVRPAYERLKKEHWAWQPLTDPTPPAIRDTTWPRDAIDRFILARLEAKGVQPVADADRVTLLRRLTLDLTGLPPTPEQIDAFAGLSIEAVVDRLLASPAFGERWGRHWLDVARYGESTGPSRNIPYPHAWKYRDYVLDAINADLPQDQFIREQVAGDLLPAETPAERNRLLTATGFLALGVKDVNQRFKVRFLMDNVDEQIDAVSRAVLGLTVSCARCHDHKFDPIPTSDYYALAGIFTSTDNRAGVRNKMGGGGLDYYDPAMLVRLSGELPPGPADQVAKLQKEVEEAKKAWDAIRGTPEGLKKMPNGQLAQRPYRLRYERLQAELDALSSPAARGLVVHGVSEGTIIADTEIRIRGEAEKLGPVVPRGFLTVFDVPGIAPIPKDQSGRLQLAAWLTSPKNPLTPRVAVNRVWHHLFGRGLVSTVDNFGVTGDQPSHPELLDYLASRYIREGWSLKKLVRAIVLTRTYQLAATATPEHLRIDPANALLWRHTPRRLDAEQLRDAVLTASGDLDRTRPGGSPAQALQMVEMRDNGPEAQTLYQQGDQSRQRSVYLPLVRGVTPRDLEAFDPVSQTLVSGQREATTVPGQALYLLNSAFIRRQALVLAERVLANPNQGEEARIQGLYRRVLSRAATTSEVARARSFLASYESASREVQGEAPARPQDAHQAAWQALAQALFASAEFRYVR